MMSELKKSEKISISAKKFLLYQLTNKIFYCSLQIYIRNIDTKSKLFRLHFIIMFKNTTLRVCLKPSTYFKIQSIMIKTVGTTMIQHWNDKKIILCQFDCEKYE